METCGNPDHHHGRNRVEFFISMVLSLPEIDHGGYFVYETLGDGRLRTGKCLTSGMRRGRGRASILAPVFLTAIAEAAEDIWHGLDPDWETGDDSGLVLRPVGMMVKHRARGLKMPQAGLMSQGLILILRDLSCHFAYVEGGSIRFVTHGPEHAHLLPDPCVCDVFREVAATVFPTFREPV